jgi:hypothetical protein
MPIQFALDPQRHRAIIDERRFRDGVFKAC